MNSGFLEIVTVSTDFAHFGVNPTFDNKPFDCRFLMPCSPGEPEGIALYDALEGPNYPTHYGWAKLFYTQPRTLHPYIANHLRAGQYVQVTLEGNKHWKRWQGIDSFGNAAEWRVYKAIWRAV